MWGGEIFVPKIPSYKITDIAKAINSNSKLKIIGIRPGEKLHEEMITEADSLFTVEGKDFYIILPNSEYLNWDKKDYIKMNKKYKLKEIKESFSYNSKNNQHYLSVNNIKKLLKNFQIN
jgi:FlaA1/EpsC-like NDP-sugar epimerase